MDTNLPFPAAYQHFVQHGLTDLEPWSLTDSAETLTLAPDFARNQALAAVCRQESGVDCELYLFARRHDQDDYAFFLVLNGQIHDRVIARHLAFSKRLEAAEPLRHESVTLTFLEWVQRTVISDIAFELGTPVRDY
jgi:hypothetical protein